MYVLREREFENSIDGVGRPVGWMDGLDGVVWCGRGDGDWIRADHLGRLNRVHGCVSPPSLLVDLRRGPRPSPMVLSSPSDMRGEPCV